MKRIVRKLLKRWLIKLEEPRHTDRRHIYTDKNGNAYYIKDILQYHGSRRVALQSVIDQMSRGIDNQQLYSLIGKCSEEIRNNKSTDAIGTLANIQSRTGDITSLKLLYKGALLGIFMEGEPDEKSKEWEMRKDRIWQNDEDARFFFMNWSLENLQGLELSSQEECVRLMTSLELEREMI